LLLSQGIAKNGIGAVFARSLGGMKDASIDRMPRSRGEVAAEIESLLRVWLSDAFKAIRPGFSAACRGERKYLI
jgi:hypothetical protein